MPLATTVRSLRTTLADRRTERIARRRLSNELAAFQTPTERTELEEILSRYATEETWEIREILNRQDNERQRMATVLGGRRV